MDRGESAILRQAGARYIALNGSGATPRPAEHDNSCVDIFGRAASQHHTSCGRNTASKEKHHTSCENPHATSQILRGSQNTALLGDGILLYRWWC
jgi:hypothetical protein